MCLMTVCALCVCLSAVSSSTDCVLIFILSFPACSALKSCVLLLEVRHFRVQDENVVVKSILARTNGYVCVSLNACAAPNTDTALHVRMYTVPL